MAVEVRDVNIENSRIREVKRGTSCYLCCTTLLLFIKEFLI